MGHGFAGHHGGDRILQIVNLCRRTGDAGRNPAIVNAAMILQVSPRVEDRGFGGDGRVGSLLQFVVRIAQRNAGQTVFGHVIFDGSPIFVGIGIDEVKSHVAALKFLGDAEQLRRITVGDWAIRADEHENLNVGGQTKGPAEKKKREADHKLHCTAKEAVNALTRYMALRTMFLAAGSNPVLGLLRRVEFSLHN